MSYKSTKDFLLNDLDPTNTERESVVAYKNTKKLLASDSLSYNSNVSLLPGEYDPKNDAAKGFNIVKKSKDGNSLYILLTYSGKVYEKQNNEYWTLTYPVSGDL